MRASRHHRGLPDVPDRHRPGGDPAGRASRRSRRSAQVKRRYPDVQTTLGVSNVSFGLNPAARAVLNSVFLDECVEAGLDSAIVHAVARSCRSPGSPRSSARSPSTWSTTGGATGYDPLQRLLELFDGVDAAAAKASRAAELAAPAAVGAAAAADHRRRAATGWRPTSTRRWPAAGAGDHQRRPAGRDEDRRRAVRLRPDAAAVRAAVGRGDEDRGGLPGAAHGAGRRRAARARSCWPRSRATCTTSARTWSTSS